LKQSCKNSKLAVIAAVTLAVLCQTASYHSLAQQKEKPYDPKLYRLSELLGAVHYLRELCTAKDNQKWRDNMKELIEAEGTSAARKATLTRQFNRGYRGYSRTYRSCTDSARDTIDRFMKESISISNELIKLSQ